MDPAGYGCPERGCPQGSGANSTGPKGCKSGKREFHPPKNFRILRMEATKTSISSWVL